MEIEFCGVSIGSSTIIFLFLAKGGHVKFEALVKYSMADSTMSLPLLLPLGAGGGVKTCYPTVPLRLIPDYSMVAHRVCCLEKVPAFATSYGITSIL